MRYFDFQRAIIDVLEKEVGHSDLHVGLASKILNALQDTKKHSCVGPERVCFCLQHHNVALKIALEELIYAVYKIQSDWEGTRIGTALKKADAALYNFKEK